MRKLYSTEGCVILQLTWPLFEPMSVILADILVAARPLLAVADTDCKAAHVDDLQIPEREQSASMRAFLRLNKHVPFLLSRTEPVKPGRGLFY